MKRKNVPKALTTERLEALLMLANTGPQGQKSDAIRELLEEVRRIKQRRSGIRPSLSDIMVLAPKFGLENPEEFFDHYEITAGEVGWTYGKAAKPVKRIDALIRDWVRRQKKFTARDNKIASKTHGIG